MGWTNSKKYPPPDYDTWLMRGSGVDDVDDGTGEFELNLKLRGGTVKVQFTSSIEIEQDYDGKSSYRVIELNSVTWAFHEDADVDYTDAEENLLKDMAKDFVEENI